MKRTELIVGEEYLLDSSPDWNTGRWGGVGTRVRVLDTETAWIAGHTYGRAEHEDVTLAGGRVVRLPRSYSRVIRGGGAGVLVEERRRSFGEESATWTPAIVQAGAIRGLYAEASRIQEGAIERTKLRNREKNEQQARDIAAQREVTEEVQDLVGFSVHGNTRVCLSVESVRALLRLAAMGANP